MNKDQRTNTPSLRIRQMEMQVKKAVREALLDHQRAGNPIAVWQDGKVVIVPPSKIPDILPRNEPCRHRD